MGSLLIGARLLLAVVFAIAGLAKLADLPGSRRALAEFGVPGRALGIAAVGLPVAEILIAAALLVPDSARLGALAALVLLLCFIAGITRALARGQAPDCHCFGQIHSAPAGRGTLMRNAALGVLAVLIAWQGPGPSIPGWVGDRSGVEMALLAAIGIAAGALWLWLDNRRLRRALTEAEAEVAALPPGLPIGVTAPAFALPDVQGKTLRLDTLCARGVPVALVFMSPDCGGCRALLPDLGRWQASLADRITVAVLSTGSAEENQPIFEEHGINEVLLQEGAEVMADYRLRATPSAVMVTSGGQIASVPALGAVAIEPLIRLTLQRVGESLPNGPVPA